LGERFAAVPRPADRRSAADVHAGRRRTSRSGVQGR
jgi:hypothetical protein